MLSVDMFSTYACVKISALTHTSAHTPYGAADKHIHTHVSIHRPAHLCRTPPFCSILLQSFCSASVVLLGVGVMFVVWVRGARERDRWRGGVRKKEVLDDPQLVGAIVSMTCSSLLLSLCLRACSSRSRADKI